MDEENEEVFTLDKKSKRIMKSKSARMHRNDIKSIQEQSSYREEKEFITLLEKHNNLMEAKKRKRTKQTS